jgi:glycosyltransferase involved in cell wall biosynthesis
MLDTPAISSFASPEVAANASGSAEKPAAREAASADIMTVGIYATSVNPSSPSQVRLQEAIFAGLRRLASRRFRFIVYSHDAPSIDGSQHPIEFRNVARRGQGAEVLVRLRAQLGQALLAAWRLHASGGRTHQRLVRMAVAEPAHFEQMRADNVRLLWNMNQHELQVPVPYIRTVWDINHRIHSMYPEFSHSRFTFDGLDAGLATSLARATYVLVGTEEGKRQVAQIYGVYPDKIRVFPFPTPLLDEEERASPEAGPGEFEPPFLFYPSRLWPHKNHVVILEALRILREQHGMRLRCVFCGADEGNLDYLTRYAKRLGVGDQVEHVGVVPDAQLPGLYRRALALVYASAVGPDNLPPLEAMALGCPVLTAEVPGAREQYGDAALFFAPTDERGLAERIRQVAENPSLRSTLVARGRARAQRWTTDDYAAAIVALLEEFAAVARAWERVDAHFT